jgi:hypothetical protein
MAGSTETAQFQHDEEGDAKLHPMNDFYDDGLVHDHAWAAVN